uniref:Uncharacterized protein n=1 Tax=Rhizophora mucronata TaxID=61149 RepID=A0A2P2IPA0_RHIMU
MQIKRKRSQRTSQGVHTNERTIDNTKLPNQDNINWNVILSYSLDGQLNSPKLGLHQKG